MKVVNGIKVDERKIYGIMIDTETANGLDDPLFYDVGWQVITSHGEKILSRSFVNRDIFNDERDMMRSCYFAEKIPNYVQELREGSRTMANIFQIRAALAKDIKDFDCKFICAHNARFDYKSLNGTMRYLTKSEYRWFTPYKEDLVWWDTMKMAQDVILTMPTYKEYCIKNGYTLANGKTPRKTAEILYRFISRDNDFIENHTGLEDVDIERQILAYCVKRHKKMRKELWGNR